MSILIQLPTQKSKATWSALAVKARRARKPGGARQRANVIRAFSQAWELTFVTASSITRSKSSAGFTFRNRLTANIEACSAPSRLDGKDSPKRSTTSCLTSLTQTNSPTGESRATYTSAIAGTQTSPTTRSGQNCINTFRLLIGRDRFFHRPHPRPTALDQNLGIDHGAVLGDTTTGLALPGTGR